MIGEGIGTRARLVFSIQKWQPPFSYSQWFTPTQILSPQKEIDQIRHRILVSHHIYVLGSPSGVNG